jgi:hypothetical protein
MTLGQFLSSTLPQKWFANCLPIDYSLLPWKLFMKTSMGLLKGKQFRIVLVGLLSSCISAINLEEKLLS